MAKVLDLVRETFQTTGSGTITLDDVAPVGFRTFAEAVADGDLSDGDEVYCAARHDTADEAQTWIGTYDATAKTITIDTVLSSTNGGAAIAWSVGDKHIVCTAVSHLVTRGITRRMNLLDTTNFATVIDVDLADTLITDTSEPASPTYSYTIQASDLKSTECDYLAYLIFGGKNNDVATRTVNAARGKNSDAFVTSVGVSNPTTANPYWSYIARWATAPVVAGDIIRIKVWASAAGVVDLRYLTIYIVPRQGLVVPDGHLWQLTSLTSALTGAITGVTYTATSLGQGYIITDPINGPVSNATDRAGGVMALEGQDVRVLSSLSDTIGQGISSGFAVPTLHSLSGSTEIVEIKL